MGQRVTFAFHYIIYVPASLHTLQRHLLLGNQQSLIRRLLLSCMSTTYVGGPGNCYWGVLFLKGQRVDGSTGQRVDRSTGQTAQWVNGSLSLSLYYIWCQAHATPLQKAHRVNGLTGQWVDGSTGHFHFHYIIYDSRRRQAHATPLQKAHSVNGLTGQWVDGSTGQTGRRVTFTFTILYMIADDARLTPPRCKKHMAYDDTRLTPHRCKKHTASFARSTAKFPSYDKHCILPPLGN